MNTLEQLETQRAALDTYINSLTQWDCHAETMQDRYDSILHQIIKLKQQQQYPIFARNKHNGAVVKFTDIQKGRVVEVGESKYVLNENIGDFIPHTDTDTWEILPYDKEKDLYHTQLVYCWDNDETHRVVLRFYDAPNKKTFTYDGYADGVFFDNYSATLPEHMKTAYKTLEK